MLKNFLSTSGPVLRWASVFFLAALMLSSTQTLADRSQTSGTELARSLNQHWTPAQGFADLIEQVSPAVVHVAISGKVSSRRGFQGFEFPEGSPFRDFFERYGELQRPQEEERSRPLGIGSGFIISADGYVVTNNHVVQNADEIVVTLEDGEEYDASLVGTDSKTDLALLKLNDASGLTYLEWGDDENSRVGDWVMAIGNPFGLGGSASTGIISARGRDIRSGPYDDYIQVDAAINRGNSGGPLFNMKGEVIGINTAIYSPNGGSVGIGFSIPSSLAKNVISQLRDNGQVERGWIGVEIQGLSEELAQGFERDNDHGALISNVVPDAPADKAGLQAGDIILKFNGEDIAEMRDLPRLVAQAEVAKEYPVEIWRDGKVKKIKLKTDRFPEDENDIASRRPDSSEDSQTDNALGAQLAEVDDELKERYKLDDDLEGVAILSVERGGLASRNGLRRGDVITSVNNRRVKSAEDVIDGIEDAINAGREKIVVLIQRQNGRRFIPMDLTQDKE